MSIDERKNIIANDIYSLQQNNKKIEKLYFEKERGVCDMTSAQTVLKDLA